MDTLTERCPCPWVETFTSDDETCVCGHVADEHDATGACTVGA